MSTREKGHGLVVFGALAATCIAGVGFLLTHAPKAEQPECDNVGADDLKAIFLPSGAGDRAVALRALALCVEAYRMEHPRYTVAVYASLYVTMQAFVIPGSLALSIIAGALYPRLVAMGLVVACATVGASTCFLLSAVFGRSAFRRLMPDTIASFGRRVEAHRDNLLFYMMFLRLTPLVPNSLVNICSSLVGMPFRIFFCGTALGLVPATALHVSTGHTLRDVAVLPGKSAAQIAGLFCLQFLALLPVLFKKRLAAVDAAALEKPSRKDKAQ